MENEHHVLCLKIIVRQLYKRMVHRNVIASGAGVTVLHNCLFCHLYLQK
jgi:hypothetical protein